MQLKIIYIYKFHPGLYIPGASLIYTPDGIHKIPIHKQIFHMRACLHEMFFRRNLKWLVEEVVECTVVEGCTLYIVL